MSLSAEATGNTEQLSVSSAGPRGCAASFGGGDGYHERTGVAAIFLEQPLAVEDRRTDKPRPLAASSRGACRGPAACLTLSYPPVSLLVC